MVGSLLFMLAMAWYFLAGGVMAGEEGVMPLRGETPDGRSQVNQVYIQFEAAGDGMAGRLESPVRSVEFMPWKDTCARRPVLVAGQALQMESEAGFGLAAPYVRRAAGDGRLLDLFPDAPAAGDGYSGE